MGNEEGAKGRIEVVERIERHADLRQGLQVLAGAGARHGLLAGEPAEVSATVLRIGKAVPETAPPFFVEIVRA